MLILPVLLIAHPGPDVMGVLVPMYIAADLLVVALHRHRIQWRILLTMLPTWIGGMVAGGLLLSQIDASQFSLMTGVCILAMLLFSIWTEKQHNNVMSHPAAAPLTGVITGFIGMTSSAGGPFLSLFLMGHQLDKEAYVSTRAWGFLFIDIAKVPILWHIGLLTPDSVLTFVPATPALLMGAVLGLLLLKRLDMSQFTWLIRSVSVFASIKLMFFG